MKKRVNLADLVKSFHTSIYYLLAKVGVDTAENGPLKVCQNFAKVEQTSLKTQMPTDGVRGVVGVHLGYVSRGEDPANGAETQPRPEVSDVAHIVHGVEADCIHLFLFY